MTNTTLAAGRLAPLTDRGRQPRPIVAAIGAVDGASVLEAARLVAERSGGAVTVLSAVEPLPTYGYGPEGYRFSANLMEIQLASRRQAIQVLMARARRGAEEGPEWVMQVRYGERAATIAQEAAALDAQLVVMGIGQHGPINRLLATETTLATLRRVRCPVLAIAGTMRTLPRTVVAAIDFGPGSIHAVSRALPLLAEGATLFLVHAWERSEMTHPALQEADDAYERALPERFARLRSALTVPASVTVKTVELVGRPVEEVLEFARGHRADLIVAGTHGRGFVERLIVGSVATALLRGSTCSVLIAPDPPLAVRSRLERHMTGTSSSRSSDEWGAELEAFALRNRGRRTQLEVDALRLGAQVQERGYTLLGAAYDPHDRRVALMFDDPSRGTVHLTRSIGHVRSVAVLAGAAEQDQALSIESEDGQTLLTFLPE